MFENIKGFFQRAVSGLSNFLGFGKINEVNKDTLITDDMSSAIQMWLELYCGNAPWLNRTGYTRSLGLPAATASEIARLVTLEAQIEIVTPGGEKNPRAEYLSKQLEPLLDNLRRCCEYGCAGGGLMFKPYVIGKEIAIDIVLPTDFRPVTYNSHGKITANRFVESKKDGNVFYHRFEEHELGDGFYTVTNKAFKSHSNDMLGTEVPLTDVPEWAELQPVQSIGNVNTPLFAYFKIPLGNAIDMKSPLGVSVYSRSVDLMQDADEQYNRYLWEFEGGELAIDASSSAFKKTKQGEVILPTGKERLFRANEFDSGESKELLKTFSPELREVPLNAGLNSILRKVEFNTGLAYGTLSDPSTVEKTAEEVKGSKQRSYAFVSDIQKALQAAIVDLVAAMDVYATLYKLAPKGEYELKFVWDDSIVVDAETERTRDLNEVRAKLMPKWQYRMKWYGEDKETAKAIVAEEEASEKKANNPFNLT